MNPRRYSLTQVAAAIHLYKSGLSLTEIAKQTAMKKTSIKWWVRREGIPTRPTGRAEQDALQRFWSYVNKNGPIVRRELGRCWEWTGAPDIGGYGRFWYKGRNWQSHRFVYMLEHGEFSEPLKICHKCDNRKCCRPEHVQSGTQADNIRQMWERKRYPVHSLQGEQNHNCKISARKVREIRRLAPLMTKKQLAAHFKVKLSMVTDVLLGRTWAWLK